MKLSFYLIGIDHAKQVIISYWYQVKRKSILCIPSHENLTRIQVGDLVTLFSLTLSLLLVSGCVGLPRAYQYPPKPPFPSAFPKALYLPFFWVRPWDPLSVVVSLAQH